MSQYKGKLTTKPVERNVTTQREVWLPAAIFICITGIIVFRDEEKSRLLKQLLTNRVFLMTMIGIIIFSVYQLSQQNDDSETPLGFAPVVSWANQRCAHEFAIL